MQRQKEVERKGPREAEERKIQIVNESWKQLKYLSPSRGKKDLDCE